jgi:hypothetical protein
MKQFILLLREDINLFDAYSPAEMQNIIQEYMAWGQSMAQQNKLVGGQQLIGDPVSLVKKDNKVLTDGPFAESKEVIGGYYILQTANVEEAMKLAETCPHLKFGGKIDIREAVVH